MQHPAGHDPSSPLLLFEKIYGEMAIAFAKNRTLGTRKVIVFEAKYPRPTRSRAYASPASLPRPSPGSLPARTGSPLAGRVSHPQDDVRNFMESIAIPPIPIDQQSLVALYVLLAPPSSASEEDDRRGFGRRRCRTTTRGCGAGRAVGCRNHLLTTDDPASVSSSAPSGPRAAGQQRDPAQVNRPGFFGDSFR